MSIHVAAGSGNFIGATTNLSNPQSFTKLVWVKHDANPAGYNDIIGAQDSGNTNSARIITEPSTAYIYNQTTYTSLGGAPTLTDWMCFALTGTTAGAGSLIGYWQDNSGGGFTSASGTGLAFTNYEDTIFSTSNVGLTAAYYMEWNSVLTSAQLNAQFLASTPVVATGNVRRYMPLANSGSAGTDTTNGYNMTVNGTITTGSGAPTFPITVNFRKTLSTIGGRTGARQLQ